MAIAIDNAQLYGRLETANRELEAYSHTLEDKVHERTQELADRKPRAPINPFPSCGPPKNS